MINLPGIIGAMCLTLALCLLRYSANGTMPPNNLFIALAGLMGGMGVVFLLMVHADSSKMEEKSERPIDAAPPGQPN